MSEFKDYKRKQIAELREVTKEDISQFKNTGAIWVDLVEDDDFQIEVSVSSEDLKAGSPKIGDMIARNPKNYSDQWLVAKQYFNDNFEPY